MRHFCRFFLFAIFSFGCFQSINAQCLLWDTEHVQALKTDSESPLYKNIITAADWFVTQIPADVTHKGQSFSGDYHNYESLSFYSWPDPANPNGPWVVRQGYINQQYKEYDFDRLLFMQVAVRYMSLAYYLTEKEEYHDGLKRWMRAWFIDPDTYMYPQMEYAQVRPGENGNHGTCWGLIEAYTFIEILEGYQLVHGLRKFDKDTNDGIHAWVKQFSHWLVTSENGKQESVAENMHSVAYDVILYYLSAFNKDKKQMRRITNSFAENRLAKQIDQEGKMPFEMEGGRVFHDHLYNLQHIVDFCIMQKNQGKNYYAQNQEIIDRVFSFMIPYMKAPETFPYTQVSDWETDLADFKLELSRMYRLNSKYSRSRIGYDVDPFETEYTVIK